VRDLPIRTLMTLVAVIALLIAGAVMLKRSNEFRILAEDRAKAELFAIGCADDS
jgi:hypothetical protein